MICIFIPNFDHKIKYSSYGLKNVQTITTEKFHVHFALHFLTNILL